MRRFGILIAAVLALLGAPLAAQIPISGLPSATTPLGGSEIFAIVQGGQTRKVSEAGIMGAPGAIGGSTASPGSFTSLSSTGGTLNGTLGATTPASAAVTTLSTTGALTYGGVTLSNSVTGTGSMVLSASPTLTGTLTAPAVVGSTSVLSSGQGGVGYKAGAGGAITQITSRTTGVTLNAVTGAITLVSASGSATPASFTVTDSSVGTNDVVVVNQDSGTDLYEIFVTAVGAGSFRITSFTTGGTTSEQPVISFAVIKGSIN